MGDDRSPVGEGTWFLFLRTSSPVNNPHVYAVAITAIRAMTIPTTAAVLRVNRPPVPIGTKCIIMFVQFHDHVFLTSVF